MPLIGRLYPMHINGPRGTHQTTGSDVQKWSTCRQSNGLVGIPYDENDTDATSSMWHKSDDYNGMDPMAWQETCGTGNWCQHLWHQRARTL
jgi:hypothetical protein